MIKEILFPLFSFFFHFYKIICFQFSLASSIHFRCSCCLLNAVASELLPSCVSYQVSPVSTSFQSHFPFFESLSESFICAFSLSADRGSWGQLSLSERNGCGHVPHLCEQQKRLNCHLRGSWAELMQGSLPCKGVTGSFTLKFWVRDVSSGYQGNF